MSELNIREPHALSVDEAIKRVGQFESLLSKYGVTPKWKGPHADIKSVGVSGSIDVSSSEVAVKLKLGMMARAAGVDGRRLEGSIRKRLRAALDGASD